MTSESTSALNYLAVVHKTSSFPSCQQSGSTLEVLLPSVMKWAFGLISWGSRLQAGLVSKRKRCHENEGRGMPSNENVDDSSRLNIVIYDTFSIMHLTSVLLQ